MGFQMHGNLQCSVDFLGVYYPDREIITVYVSAFQDLVVEKVYKLQVFGPLLGLIFWFRNFQQCLYPNRLHGSSFLWFIFRIL